MHENIAVVIPCYKVAAHILGVIAAIPPRVGLIVCVDDACPEGSGKLVESQCRDSRVRVLYHDTNQGIGGAMVTGYRAALESGAAVAVKIDGDGQMDPGLIPLFVDPILSGKCDYTKGNRFFRPENLRGMPVVRLVGNGILSFMTKLSTGYWDLFDPTNGYTAIRTTILNEIPLEKISRTYFFESDLLFRLNVVRAVVLPMTDDADMREAMTEAIAAYQKAVSLDPQLAAAYVNLGTLYFGTQQYEKAANSYRRALSINPDYPLAHFNMGNLYDELGDTDQAQSHYQAALKLDPNYADAHYNLALLFQSSGKTLKAVRHWQTYLKLDSSSAWSAIARRELDKLSTALVVPGTNR